MSMPTQRRARDWDLPCGDLPPGPYNAITDVSGVLVGHTTLIEGDGALVPGSGPVRTGVTVILPHGGNLFRQKVPAAVHTINGFGKPFGFEQVRALGAAESPIALTNTLNVGLVADALVQHAIVQSPEIGIHTTSVNVLVGETNDSYLNDLQGRHVRAEHVFAALRSAASGPVLEGAVGAATGTMCYGWKGGIGTASRRLADIGGFILGALVQANFGRASHLTIAGVPVGKSLQPPNVLAGPARDKGSVMIVLATDAPLDGRQLQRLCVRAAAGLARTGSVYGHGSGDFVIAFSTAQTLGHDAPPLVVQRNYLPDEAAMDALFQAVAETVAEAVYNALCAAKTVTGRDGHTGHALPIADAAAMVQKFYARGMVQ